MSFLIDQWFLERLHELNNAVATTGEPVEGNLFYNHKDPSFPHAKISEQFKEKRHNLLAASQGKKTFLEIGVNAGHSALMLLHNNPDLTYYGVDIYEHKYTAKAVELLKKTFAGRVHFYAGDSIHTLPELRAHGITPAFDVVHIDGNHALDHCKTDTYNAMHMAAPGAWIIIDDTDLEHIKKFYLRLVKTGLLTAAAPHGWQPNIFHEIGRTQQNDRITS